MYQRRVLPDKTFLGLLKSNLGFQLVGVTGIDILDGCVAMQDLSDM